jgi:hypothetical protein
MNRRATAFSYHLSINTSDDVDVESYAKKQKFGASSSKQVKTTSSLTVTPLLQKTNGDQNQLAKNMDSLSVSSSATNPITTSLQSNEFIHQEAPNASTSAQAIAPSINDLCPTGFVTIASLNASLAAMEKSIKVINEKVERSHIDSNKIFDHNGRNLVTDFPSKTIPKWALAVSDHLWDKTYIQNHCMLATNKSTRPPMSPTRVGLMKSAMISKFDYLANDQQKIDKHWLIIVDKINNKGRNIAQRVRDLFKANQREVNAANANNNNNNNVNNINQSPI